MSRNDKVEAVLKAYNTGKGIKVEDRDKIFDRYEIISPSESKSSGKFLRNNGLGLAICKSAVELLGGSITIDSKVGEYAEFIVTIPQLEVNSDTSAIVDFIASESVSDAIPVYQGSVTTETGEYPSVLVVDDNEEICSLLKSSLHGYDIATAPSAEKALELIKNHPPMLVITDVMMPGMDGLEFTMKLKNNKHTMHIPVIMLSAKNSLEERIQGVNNGADAYISKPFSIKELTAVVNRLLSRDDKMKEYYESSASAFDYRDGKLMSNEDRIFMDALTDYIDRSELQGSATVENMADALSISVRNLYRRFKELDLPTPNVYITEQKLKKVSRLLKTTGKNVDELIYECGFNNRTSFYREFKNTFGMSPKEYRKQFKNEDKSL